MPKLINSVVATGFALWLPAAAHAAVTISNDPTSNVSCTRNTCVPTATNAVLNVGDLTNLLAQASTTVTTTGSGVQSNDIDVEAALGWSGASRLTLKAHKFLRIDQTVSVVGTEGLQLTYGKTSDLLFGSQGNVTFPGLTGTLSINGNAYTLVGDIAMLAADIVNQQGYYYALGNSDDASQDGTYSTTPIQTGFGGIFEGLGNVISNFSINDSTDSGVGLFSSVAFQAGGPLPATLRDIGLVNVNVVENYGIRRGKHAPGAVTVGALVANLGNNARVDNSYSTGTVTDIPDGAVVGGLVGDGYPGPSPGSTISNSWSSANVSGFNAGGLAGFANTIINSHATGNVSSIQNPDTIGSGYAGGLVFEATDIENSYATGSVQISADAAVGGGLAGRTLGQGTIVQSFATGTVQADGGNGTPGDVALGGLIAWPEPTPPNVAIVNSYATGAVTSSIEGGPPCGDGDGLGGLIGGDEASAKSSYSTGAVSGIGCQGGFIGSVKDAGKFTNSYWDTQTSGQSYGTGDGGIGGIPGNVKGVTGLATQQLQSGLPKGFNPKYWTYDSTGIINSGFPYLVANPPPQ